MKRWMNNIWVARLVVFVIGVVLVLGGIGGSLGGALHYRNYWGGLVFAPWTVLLGILVLGTLVVKWKTLNHKLPAPRKLKGRAARLARQAKNTKFPIDEFRKW